MTSFELSLAGLCVCGTLLAGCGSNAATGPASGGGQVTDAWRAYCVATFTKDYTVTEFGDPLFQARVGDAYLMSAYGKELNQDHAELVYLISAGPYAFSIDAPVGSRDFPFTTNCAFDATTSYYAVFKDVSVYDSAELKNKICDLPANTVKVRNPSSTTGYQSVDNSLSFSGPTTYEVYLNAFSEQCGGAKTGFVSVPMTAVLGTQTWLVPIASIIGPS